jgi:hypothetical protein
MTFLKTSLRAFFAAIMTGGGMTYAAAVENGGSLHGFSDATWFGIALATVTAFGGVWGFVNIKTNGEVSS